MLSWGVVNSQAMSITSESDRYRVRSPDVRIGNSRVKGTRVRVYEVVGLLQNGETIDGVIASCVPARSKAQVYECLPSTKTISGCIKTPTAHADCQRPAISSARGVSVPRAS